MSAGLVRWVSVFVDVTADRLDTSAAFWTSVTGASVGSPFGERDEFLPLEAEHGDPCLWLQRTQEGPLGCHPDLYVEDVDLVGGRALELGATHSATHEGLVVLRSPGGLPFCLVRHRGQSVLPEPVGPEGARCAVDQVCLDIPADRFDEECDFWAALTGWPRTDEHSHDEFDRLRHPPELPYAFLLQRLDDDQPTVTAHLDLSCDDREQVTAWHERLGATTLRRTPDWTVMRDPAGMVYCNTGRRPGDV